MMLGLTEGTVHPGWQLGGQRTSSPIGIILDVLCPHWHWYHLPSNLCHLPSEQSSLPHVTQFIISCKPCQRVMCHWGALPLALFDMPNLNRFDIFSISIFCKIALSITILISIFSKITISISISISIFLELPYRYRYRYRYFSELPYRYRYRYRYFQLLHIDIDIDIDIFQKCRYIDNRYVISIYRTGLKNIDFLQWYFSSHKYPNSFGGIPCNIEFTYASYCVSKIVTYSNTQTLLPIKND